jgi:DNA-binding beta-propeller fold protein YncE
VVTTVTTGFDLPSRILYDGSNIWVTDNIANTLLKLNSDGSIAQTISISNGPRLPVFDGTNIWVPHQSVGSVTVVRIKDAAGNSLATPFVLASLTGNGLGSPLIAAFDGERILVTTPNTNRISLWKAADLTPLGFVYTSDDTSPTGACSDGLNFWITMVETHKLARF